jgi:drug/metabolite transporter (DMT)-like permease
LSNIEFSKKQKFKKTLFGIVLVVIATLSWSTAGLFTRVVTTDIPTTLFWRSLFGGITVLVFQIVSHRSRKIMNLSSVNRGEAIAIATASVATCLYISAFFYTSIANVSFIYGMSALVTVMAAWLLLGKRPDKLTVVAAIIATLGVFILVRGGQTFSDFIGLGLAGAMTLLMALLPVLTHRFPNVDGIKVAYLSAFLIAFFMSFKVGDFTLSSHNTLWLILYGVINVGLGFGVYLVGSKMVAPTTSAIIGLVEVPLAPIWAAIIFSEKLTSSVIFGGVIIFSATIMHILITYFKDSHKPAAKLKSNTQSRIR